MAAQSSVNSLRGLLVEAVEEISSLPEEPCEAEAAAFNKFYRAATQASSGKLAPPADLLDELEPKDAVLRFLLRLHERRRIYRKQIAAVMSILLETSWISALQASCDSMPSELQILLQDVSASTPSAEAEASRGARPLPDLRGPGDTTPLPDLAVAAASEGGYANAEAPAVAAPEQLSPETAEAVVAALGRLQEGHKEIEKLDYCAVNTDDAIDAFERFRRAVLRVVKSPGPEGGLALDQLEPKGRILDFLVDFHARQNKYRLRVSDVLLRLLNYDDWKAAVESDPSVKAAVRELTEDLSQPKRLTVVTAGIAVNLGGAAAAALSHGGVGALYVRVIAAYDLAGAERLGRAPDPYVRITLDGRMKRTNTACQTNDPHWDSSPFLFEVASLESIVRFEILDTDLIKDVPLGSACVAVSEAPRAPGFSRHALGETPGELELELVFMPGEDATDPRKQSLEVQALEQAIQQLEALPGPDDMASGSWLVTRVGQPAVTTSWSSRRNSLACGNNGPFLCPAGHTIDKRKTGLRWHEGWVGYKHRPYCDICQNPFEREEARWRCQHHCHYDVCERCYEARTSVQ